MENDAQRGSEKFQEQQDEKADLSQICQDYEIYILISTASVEYLYSTLFMPQWQPTPAPENAPLLVYSFWLKK